MPLQKGFLTGQVIRDDRRLCEQSSALKKNEFSMRRTFCWKSDAGEPQAAKPRDGAARDSKGRPQKTAMADEKIRPHIAGKTVVKAIVVPRRLVNIAVK